ncbi:MAG: hypothetical protein GF408_04600 [Candidatus Omnitrophica bacterium]|nr:hypothetical protein [Candidatus Omnitrophota bacterium]
MVFKKFKKEKRCCEKCQNYWTCERKWYRGEKKEENQCCDLCSFYSICWKNPSKK